MTVESRTSEAKIIYMVSSIAVGDTFNIPFKYLSFDENLKVAVRNQVDGSNNSVLNDLVLDTDYSISNSDGTNGVWGTVTFLKAYDSLWSVVIYRSVPISQNKIFNSQTIFSTTMESALDKLTMIAQDMAEEDKLRAIHAPIDENLLEDGMTLPSGKAGYLYTNEFGKIDVGELTDISKSIRQPDSEEPNSTFIIDKTFRRDKILAFNSDADVELMPKYTAGEDINISDSNQISNIPYTGSGDISISDHVISAIPYTAGDGIGVNNHEISAIPYTGSGDISISDHVISALPYTAGDGISVNNHEISTEEIRIADVNDWRLGDIESSAWLSVCYGNGRFVAVASDTSIAMYSTDGITWTEALATRNGRLSVTYGNGRFVALASSGNVAYSYDGITWTETTLPTLPAAAGWHSVTYGNGRFVAVAYGTNQAAYSDDGITWTLTTMPASANWRSVTYGNGRFVAVASGSDQAAYSYDGITWTGTTLPAAANWLSVTYGNGRFVAVGIGVSCVTNSMSIYEWLGG